MTSGQPAPQTATNGLKTRIIIGFAMVLFAVVLVGLGIHRVLEIGTCSSTGYTRYGPAPLCPKGTGWYDAFLTGGVTLIVGGSFLLFSTVGVGLLFMSIGVGALSVGLSSNPTIGKAFPLLFGGCFLLAGAGWTGATVVLTLRRRSGPNGVALNLRALTAAVVWLLALGAALALGKVAANGSRTTPPFTLTVKQITDGQPLPQLPGTPTIAATSRGSLFKEPNLASALQTLTAKFGSQANIVAATIYPGELEVVEVDSSGDGRLAVVPATGRPQIGQAIPLPSATAVYLSQLLPATPAAAAAQVAAQAGVSEGHLTAFVLHFSGPNSDWRILAAGGREFTIPLTGGKVT